MLTYTPGNDQNTHSFRSINTIMSVCLFVCLPLFPCLTGLDILGESQLVGNPALPELNLPPQYPSVAMLNWTNGLGNARYHVLKTLIENFKPGDKLVNTTVILGKHRQC